MKKVTKFDNFVKLSNVFKTSGIKELLNRTHLFNFDNLTDEKFSRYSADLKANRDHISSQFKTPFDTVALVMPANLDGINNDEMLIIVDNIGPGEYVQYVYMTTEIAKRPIEVLLQIGLKVNFENTSLQTKPVEILYIHRKTKQSFQPDINSKQNAELYEMYEDIAINAFKYFFTMVFTINNTHKFIVEVSPKGMNKKKFPKQKKAIASNKRNQYILVEPDVLRKRMNWSNPNAIGESKAAHLRRGHYRTLRSEFYKNRQGESIWIPPVWVGPEEAVVENAIYRVRLDK